jgi:DNA-binding NarL/FixJ family response regulator
MASPSVREGTLRKNPQSPREKGAECEVEDVDRQRQAAKTLHKDTSQKAAQRAIPEAVAMRMHGLTMRGGTEQTIRRQVLRAIVQDIGQWRPPGMTDKDIAQRLEVSGDTVKNQKRQPFNPLPDTSQVREIMAEMAGKLGLTLTVERLSALLNQAG